MWVQRGVAQIMHAVGIAGKTLVFDRSEALPAHDTYFALAEACMATNPAERPSFEAMHLVSIVERQCVKGWLQNGELEAEKFAKTKKFWWTLRALRWRSRAWRPNPPGAPHSRPCTW